MKALTREEFREQVFVRDKNRCIICEASAKDAHLGIVMTVGLLQGKTI
jgi:hypothetical protein